MRGTVHLRDWEKRLIAEREAVTIVQRCSRCDWTTEGPLGDTRPAFQAHLSDEHPDVTVKHRRRRIRPGGQVNGAKHLDDNIAAARAQGAATWETT